MHLRRFLFALFALALAPPGFAQSLAKNFTLNAANQCAVIGVSDLATVGITVTGTFSATLQPEVSIAGQSPGNTQVTPTTSNTAQATITTTGNYVAAVAGFDTFLLCVSSYASGTANVYLNPSGAVNASVIGGGSGGLAWNLLTNATGNMSIQNGTHTSTFQQTSAAQWLWANTTAAASSTTPQSAPPFAWEGTWWGPSLASAVDGWSLEDVPGNSTTMIAGKTSTASETSGVVTIAGTGMTVFPDNLPSLPASGQGNAVVIFQGFSTLTWLNGLTVSLLTNTSSSITFNDPTDHANQGSAAETAVTAVSAQSTLTLQQVAGSAPLGVVQLLNPTAATATSVPVSPLLQFSTNYWTGSASAPEVWNIYSRGIVGGNAASSLILSHIGNPADSGSILLMSNGTTCPNMPNLGFYNNNIVAGTLTTDAAILCSPPDGTTFNNAISLQTLVAGVAASLLGNEGAVGGADIDIGSTNTARTNTTGPNYGVVLGGVYLSGSPGAGGETFQPASGSSKNFGIWVGTKFNPTAGSTSYAALNVTPIITGTTSGNTAALSIDPQLTTTHLTGTNCSQTWHDGTATGTTPGNQVGCMDYSGNLTVSGFESAATHKTATVCSAVGTAANPSVVTCGAAAAGLVYCDVAASAGTCTINTSAVTTNSTVLITPNGADGTALSKTCNTAPTVVPFAILAAKVTGTSFTVNMPTETVNGSCFEYSVIN